MGVPTSTTEPAPATGLRGAGPNAPSAPSLIHAAPAGRRPAAPTARRRRPRPRPPSGTPPGEAHPPGRQPGHPDHHHLRVAEGDVDGKPHPEGVHRPGPGEHHGSLVAGPAEQPLGSGRPKLSATSAAASTSPSRNSQVMVVLRPRAGGGRLAPAGRPAPGAANPSSISELCPNEPTSASSGPRRRPTTARSRTAAGADPARGLHPGPTLPPSGLPSPRWAPCQAEPVEHPGQRRRPVGDDAVHPEPAELLHLGLLLDGPDVDGQTLLVGHVHEALVDQGRGRRRWPAPAGPRDASGPAPRRPAPTGEAGHRHGAGRRRDLGGEGGEGVGGRVEERGDDDVVGPAETSQQGGQRLLVGGDRRAVCLMSRLSTTPGNSSSTSSSRAIRNRRSSGARPRNGYPSGSSPGVTSAPGAHQ